MASPTLQQLRYFVALGEALHFGDAAAACGVSQPNLSAQVKELEKALGEQLVERVPRQIILTPAGEKVLDRARSILRDVDDLIETTRQGDSSVLTGRLRVGVIPTVAPYVLPRVLPSVRAAYPGLELHLSEDFTDRLVPRLTNGELDLLLLALPIDQPGLEAEVIAQEPFVLIAPNEHPLTRKKTVDTTDFAPTDLLLLQDGHCLRDQALDVCNLPPGRRPLVEATSLTTLVQMVANGLGVTLLPLMALNVDVPGDEIAVRPFGKPAPGRSLGLVWRAASGRSEAYRSLAGFMREQTSLLLDEAHDRASSGSGRRARKP